MLDLILSKYKAYLYLAIVAVICYGSFSFGKKIGVNKEFARMSVELNSVKETVIEMNMQATNAIVNQQIKINEVAKNADTQIQELETHVDNAADIADRLREQLKKALRDGSACKPTSKPSSGSEEARNLFADLYARCDERSGAIAKYADEVTIAHKACLASSPQHKAQ